MGGAFVNKVLLKHSHAHPLCIIYGCSVLEHQSQVVVTVTLRPTKPKMSTLSHFTGNVHQPCTSQSPQGSLFNLMFLPFVLTGNFCCWYQQQKQK